MRQFTVDQPQASAWPPAGRINGSSHAPAPPPWTLPRRDVGFPAHLSRKVLWPADAIILSFKIK